MRNFIDIVGSVVLGIKNLITIRKVVTISTGTYKIYCDDVLYVQIARTVSIGTNDYTVTEVNRYDNTMTVTGTSPILATSFLLYSPYFFHGTPIAVNDELKKEDRAENKEPMVWLLETYKEKKHQDPQSAIDVEVDCSLYFLTHSDDTVLTDQAYSDYIDSMRKLMDLFFIEVKNRKDLFNVWDFTDDVTSYPKFGVYLSNAGVRKSMFSDVLSGVGVSCTFEINGTQPCCIAVDYPYFADIGGDTIFTDQSGNPLALN